MNRKPFIRFARKFPLPVRAVYGLFAVVLVWMPLKFASALWEGIKTVRYELTESKAELQVLVRAISDAFKGKETK